MHSHKHIHNSENEHRYLIACTFGIALGGKRAREKGELEAKDNNAFVAIGKLGTWCRYGSPATVGRYESQPKTKALAYILTMQWSREHGNTGHDGGLIV